MRPDRISEFSAYFESLPPEEQVRLIIVFWLNAVATLAVQAAALALVVRTGRRAASDDHHFAAISASVLSPSAALVATASVAHVLVRQRLRRRLDQRIRTAQTAA